MKKLLASSLAIVTVATSLGATPVFAQTTSQSQNAVAKCSKLSARIGSRIAKVDARLSKRQAMYTKHDAEVQKLITKAKAAGINTDKAQADLQTWEGQTTAVKNAMTAIVTKLNSAKNLSCTNDPAAVKTAVQAAKDQVTVVENLRHTKQAYFTGTLKPDLTTLRDQVKNKNN